MIVLKIILIMLIGYTGLSLYMQHRIDKKYKAFKKRLEELENKQ
jgi:hypothetical protein